MSATKNGGYRGRRGGFETRSLQKVGFSVTSQLVCDVPIAVPIMAGTSPATTKNGVPFNATGFGRYGNVKRTMPIKERIDVTSQLVCDEKTAGTGDVGAGLKPAHYKRLNFP